MLPLKPPHYRLLVGYSNEILVIEGLADFNHWTYLYLVFMIIISLIGIKYQKKEDADSELVPTRFRLISDPGV